MNDVAADLTRSLDAENPWPGLMPFTEATQAYFHGRDTEAAELLRRVRRERLTILFGQSGLGKTSLLCAGLFPRLRGADFLPVYIRLDWTTAQIFPVAQIKQTLTENLTEYSVEGRPPRPDETLWGYFHDKATEFWSHRNRLVIPVLVFDQFEEIFTVGHGAATAGAVLDELAGLIENHPPASVRAALDDNPEAARGYDFAKESCKVILALREDFLPDLEGLRRRLPSIMENRMRLTRMDGRQARDAILASGSHLVAPGVAEKVIVFVAASRGRSERETLDETELSGLEIEPALLSIVCSELNNKRIRLGQAQITADLLDGARQEIVGQFYESSLAGIDPALRLFIEEQLLTAEGYRDTRPLAEALREPEVTRADIDRLVARRLLRIEERFGTQWVELTHDLLTEVIRQRRDLRRERTAAARAAEQRAQAERERAERAEAEASRERAEREAQEKLAREAAARESAAHRLVRRTRIALGATVLALVLAVAAGIYAWSQRQVAEARRQEAAADYSLALEAALRDIDIVDRHHRSGRLGTEVARVLLDAASRTFGRLPKVGWSPPQAHEDANTTRSRVRLFSQLTATYLDFGDLRAAQDSASKEVELANYLHQSGNNSEGEPELADSHARMGDVLRRRGELARALEEYSEGRRISTALVEKDPQNGERQHDLATAHKNAGEALEFRGDSLGAFEEYQAGLAIMASLVAKDPSKDGWQRDLGLSHISVGNVLAARDDPKGATGEYESALSTLSQLAAKDPTNDGLQRDISVVHDRIGEIALLRGDKPAAVKEYEADLAIMSELGDRDPTNARWQLDLSVAHNKLGAALQDQGDLGRAMEEFRAELAITAVLAAKDPANAIWQRELAVSHNRVGGVLQAQLDPAGALSEYREGLRIISALAIKDPANVDWQEVLAASHTRLGAGFKAQGDLAAALNQYSAVLAIMNGLIEKDATNAGWQRRISEVHKSMGELYLTQGDSARAQAEFGACLTITELIVARGPGNAQIKQLAASCRSKAAAMEGVSESTAR